MKTRLNTLSKVVLATILIVGLYLFIRQPILRRVAGVKDAALTDVRASQEILAILGGRSTSSTTLLVFANHAEQRIGGGFVGSVGLLKGNNGKVSIDSIRSIYYYDHRLEGKGIFVPPPNYLSSMVAVVAARDSLIYEDTQQSAKTFRDLFARESGIYADNVVIITPKVLELLLNYTGPITLPDYNLTIDKTNILTVLQTEVETGVDKQTGKDPKTILGVLANGIVAKLPDLKPEQIISLNRDALQLLATQQAYIYSGDAASATSLEKWQSGLAKAGGSDTLLISSANHNATKSSQAIKQKVDATVTINSKGEAQMQLVITRQHTQDYSGKYTDPKTGEQQWLIGDDLSWVQATFPVGAQFIRGEGFAAASTNPNTFGRDMLTKPNTTTRAELVVKLPRKYDLTNDLAVKQLILSQFGWFGQDYTMTVTPPEDYTPSSGAGQKLADGRSVRYTGFQINDKQFDYVFKRSR